MAPPETRNIARFATWLALAYALALSVPFLIGMLIEADLASLGGAAIAATWTAAPVVAAAIFVRASATRAGALFYLGFELLLIASFACAFVAVRASSTGGFIFIVWPLAQWVVLITISFIAFAFGWRQRPGFMEA
jgi:hypothetical protein